MAETLKSILFVMVTVMIALILQAHAGVLSPADSDAADATTPMDQMQVYQ